MIALLQVLLAGVKRNALELRQRELEFHVERYTNLATQASVVAGFSFESLVEIEVPEGTHPLLSSCYFIFGSSAMALALYVLCVASFACVFGHRLALQGPHGSLERAVHILIQHRAHIFTAAGVSLFCLVGAAVLMAWMKMGYAAFVVTLIFLAFAYFVYVRLMLMFDTFAIPDDQLVTGATRVHNPCGSGGAVDLSRLNPASRSYGAARACGGSPASEPVGDSSIPPQLRMQQQQPPAAAGAATTAAAAAGGGGGSGGAGGGGGYTRLQEEASPYLGVRSGGGGGGGGGPSDAASATIHHEGHLFKKGEYSFLGGESSRRRYFVLRGTSLFYFKSWEDYAASAGMRAAINLDTPIDISQYEAVLAVDDGSGAAAVGPNRFDLVPTIDPLARRWQLQATTQQEAGDWLMALNAARRLAPPAMRHAGNVTVLMTAP